MRTPPLTTKPPHMPPSSTPRPTTHQREHIDALHTICTERERLEHTYRDTIIACLDTGLTPAQIEKFAGVNKETVKRTAARHTTTNNTPAPTPSENGSPPATFNHYLK